MFGLNMIVNKGKTVFIADTAVHEYPRVGPNSKDILENGMVFTIEPGIYIPEIGGVRIEDDILIKENGIEVLTKSPKNLLKI